MKISIVILQLIKNIVLHKIIIILKLVLSSKYICIALFNFV